MPTQSVRAMAREDWLPGQAWQALSVHQCARSPETVEGVGLWLLRCHRTLTKHALEEAARGVLQHAPHRAAVFVNAVDVAVRASRDDDGPLLDPWLTQWVREARRSGVSLPIACVLEAAVVAWVDLGRVGPAVLAERPWCGDVGTDARWACPYCPAAFTHPDTHAAHCLAHVRTGPLAGLLRARRSSVLRQASLRRAVAAAREPVSAERKSPGTPIGRRAGEGPRMPCAVCGDAVQGAFCDLCNRWEWLQCSRTPRGGSLRHSDGCCGAAGNLACMEDAMTAGSSP